MSKRLVEMINEVIAKEGRKGKLRLALAAERGEQMIDRYVKGSCSPSPNVAFRLALACGRTEEEALTLVKECSSQKARETA